MATWRKALEKLRQERRDKGKKPVLQNKKAKDGPLVASVCENNSTTISAATCDSTCPPNKCGASAGTAPAGQLRKDLMIERTFAITDSVSIIRSTRISMWQTCNHTAQISECRLHKFDYIKTPVVYWLVVMAQPYGILRWFLPITYNIAWGNI